MAKQIRQEKKSEKVSRKTSRKTLCQTSQTTSSQTTPPQQPRRACAPVHPREEDGWFAGQNSWLCIRDLFREPFRHNAPRDTQNLQTTDVGGEMRCGSSMCYFQPWSCAEHTGDLLDGDLLVGDPLNNSLLNFHLLDTRPCQLQWRWLTSTHPALRHLEWASRNPSCILVLLSAKGEGAYVIGALRPPRPKSAEALFFLAPEPDRWSFFANDGALQQTVLEATDLFVRFIPGQHLWNTSNLLLQIQDIFRLRHPL